MIQRTIGIVATLLAVALLASCAPGGTGGGGAGVTTTESAPATSTTTGTVETTQAVLTGRFEQINASGVSGEVTVTISGDQVRVAIAATGLTPNQVHAQHIHSLATTDSSCPPTQTAGTIIREPDAEKYYGAVLVPLEPFPSANQTGSLTYEAAVTGVPANALPLDGRAIVLHGLDVQGTYDGQVPVACAVLRAVTGAAPPSAETTPLGGAETSTATPSVQTTP